MLTDDDVGPCGFSSQGLRVVKASEDNSCFRILLEDLVGLFLCPYEKGIFEVRVALVELVERVAPDVAGGACEEDFGWHCGLWNMG